MNNIPSQFLPQRVGVAGWRVLGLDLDGVCADYTEALRRYCMEKMGRPREDFPEPTTYNLGKASWPFASTADYFKWHRSAVEDGLYATLPIYPGVVETLTRLSDAHVYIRIVSHRLFLSGLHHRIVTDTSAWLEHHGVPFMSLCFTGLKDSVEATVYVEDSPEQVTILRSAERGSVVVYDQLYNRSLEGPRMYGWDASADLLLQTFEENLSGPAG